MRSGSDTLFDSWIASLSPGLRLAVLLLPKAEQAAAFENYRELCQKMTAERVALEAFHEHHPLALLRERDECVIRGVSDKTLAGMKTRGELPFTAP